MKKFFLFYLLEGYMYISKLMGLIFDDLRIFFIKFVIIYENIIIVSFLYYIYNILGNFH